MISLAQYRTRKKYFFKIENFKVHFQVVSRQIPIISAWIDNNKCSELTKTGCATRRDQLSRDLSDKHTRDVRRAEVSVG
jgi:hypothetical protein